MAKNENEKHDHKWTKLLKVGIFAAMMLAPLFAIGVKCAYVTFNKNAKDSYYGETINETKYNSETLQDVKVGNTYYIITPNTNEYTIQSNNTQITVNNVYRNGTYVDITALRFYVSGSNNYLTIQGIGNEPFTTNTTSVNNIQFDYVGVNNEYYLNAINSILYSIDYNKYSYLDNVFYYAVDQMKENELFNWTRNTAIYNGVNAVTTGLGITTDAIPILLVYWILLTLIYVIFDIVIETFTWLTHLFSNKVIK